MLKIKSNISHMAPKLLFIYTLYGALEIIVLLFQVEQQLVCVVILLTTSCAEVVQRSNFLL